MPLTENRRQLVIIGGAEDRTGECTILREFVRRAGGNQARIVIMTVATSLPKEGVWSKTVGRCDRRSSSWLGRGGVLSPAPPS